MPERNRSHAVGDPSADCSSGAARLGRFAAFSADALVEAISQGRTASKPGRWRDLAAIGRFHLPNPDGSRPDQPSRRRCFKAPIPCRVSSICVWRRRICNGACRPSYAIARTPSYGRGRRRLAVSMVKPASSTATSTNETCWCAAPRGRWKVAAVLDWEFAISGSPLADLGSFLRYERTARPGRRAAFLGGIRAWRRRDCRTTGGVSRDCSIWWPLARA